VLAQAPPVNLTPAPAQAPPVDPTLATAQAPPVDPTLANAQAPPVDSTLATAPAPPVDPTLATAQAPPVDLVLANAQLPLVLTNAVHTTNIAFAVSTTTVEEEFSEEVDPGTPEMNLSESDDDKDDTAALQSLMAKIRDRRATKKRQRAAARTPEPEPAPRLARPRSAKIASPSAPTASNPDATAAYIPDHDGPSAESTPLGITTSDKVLTTHAS
jgi:hypothetical protein